MEVDPDDMAIERWIVTCHMVDPAVGYRRHVVIAAFDNVGEMEEMVFRKTWLHEAIAEGRADEKAWMSGRHLPVGQRQPSPQPRGRRTRR
jgi:hypothetical protein